MKPREKEEITPTTEKCKTFETVSAIATEDNRGDDQVELVATAATRQQLKTGQQLTKRKQRS